MNDPLFIGLLSGTSMDAIDVALVGFKKEKYKEAPQLLATLNYPIPSNFRNQCLEIVQLGRGSIDDYGYLDAMAGELFANAVLSLLQKNSISPREIRAIGSHGQTLRHRPNAHPPYTLQIGDPNIIAERTGIPTIADFRRRDMAAGGQGAPLAPSFHAAVFGSETDDRVIVNIGGISNLTVISKGDSSPLAGFDSGPGNCLMDSWARLQWNMPFDRDGLVASTGKILEPLLEICLDDEYFSKKPPKSTGREYFNLRWFAQKMNALSKIMRKENESQSDSSTETENYDEVGLYLLNLLTTQQIAAEDIQATLSALTARSIAKAIQANAPKNVEIFICGGGAHNIKLMADLNDHLHGKVKTTDTLSFPPDWIEAVLFAWLAKQTLEGKSGNCPQATGAKHAIPLGGIFGYCPNI